MSFDPKNVMFTEKYRPNTVDNVVGDFKEKIKKYLENPQQLPHFLFYSSAPGTGKTTISKAIIHDLGCDSVIINSSDDRKIETVREKVKSFASTKSTNGMRRCIFLDEVDGMLKTSQEALRNIMETYASNCFFILTCNNLNKIHDAIQSRCTKIGFAYPNKKEIYDYLEMICNKEEMKYSEEGINSLINNNYPSIRDCVSILQDLKTEGKSVVLGNINKYDEMFDKMWNLLKADKWYEIKKYVMESDVDSRELNTFFWNKALDENNVKIIQITCRNEKDISWGSDSKIIFITSLLELTRHK